MTSTREYTLAYEQSAEERYDTDVNERVRSFISNTAEMIGEAGGIDFGSQICDQQFYFRASPIDAELISVTVELMLGRSVELDEIPDDEDD